MRISSPASIFPHLSAGECSLISLMTCTPRYEDWTLIPFKFTVVNTNNRTNPISGSRRALENCTFIVCRVEYRWVVALVDDVITNCFQTLHFLKLCLFRRRECFFILWQSLQQDEMMRLLRIHWCSERCPRYSQKSGRGDWYNGCFHRRDFYERKMNKIRKKTHLSSQKSNRFECSARFEIAMVRLLRIPTSSAFWIGWELISHLTSHHSPFLCSVVVSARLEEL